MTSERECLESLLEAAKRLGESPTKAQYEEMGLTPSASTILRVVGGWNVAKTKAGFETEPSTGTRTASKPANIELPDGMEWENLSQDQRWHYKHADWNTERSLQRQNAHRAWANELQRTRGGCTRCAEQDPACLDFHHVNEDEKEMAVGKMISFGYSRDRIKAEIEKCIVLCANCHRKEHYNPPLD